MSFIGLVQGSRRVVVKDTVTGEIIASINVQDAHALSDAQLQELADFAARLRSRAGAQEVSEG